MFGFLLRFARQVVAGVMSQLTQQMNIVQQQAYRPMQMMVQQVTGGVWIGKGADAGQRRAADDFAVRVGDEDTLLLP